MSAPALSSPLLGTSRSLAGSKFCRQYQCRLVAFGRFGDNPSYVPTYVLNAPGVAVRVVRYPSGQTPKQRDIERAPAQFASMTVDARLPWPKLLSRTPQAAAAYFTLATGTRYDPTLFSNCIEKARFKSRQVEGLDDLIAVAERSFIRCHYAGGKVDITAAVRWGERP